MSPPRRASAASRPARPAKSFLGRARVRDGFDNVTARLGLGADNMLAGSTYRKNRIVDQTELEDMYRTSWVVGRMVEVVAEDMVRAGLEIKGPMAPEDIDRLHAGWRETGIPGRLSDAIKWGRLYGGALAILLIDGQALDEPLDLDTLGEGSFKGLIVADRWQVTPSEEKIRDLGPMLGYPAYYTLDDVAGLDLQRVHHSRVLRFVGVELPRYEKLREQGWGASVVERAFDRILALDSATYGSANLMMKSFLRVFSIKDFRRILAQGGPAESGLMKMMEMVRQTQSNEGITIVDSEDQVSAINWSFAGVYDALQAFGEQISGASGIPLVRLFGQAPKGFATGDSDLQMYYETISTAQEDDLRGAVWLLLEVLYRSVFGKPPPDGLTFSFAPLASPSPLEKSQIATADSQAIAALTAGGIIDHGQALEALRESGRVTGRFTGIRDEDIEAAREANIAPPLPEMPDEDPLSLTPGPAHDA
ncbi:DUF1073 domain-containing protein [Rhodospirillum sp. A1_3_36]|uniref:DUF1073 domain-containing protein n=1 Tax=Rhodospirillum sp. A1_3_36 TaxID=3391666 RepID=UPI0039A6250D